MASFGVAADYPELRKQFGLPSREDLINRVRADQPSDDDFANSEPVPLTMWAPTETPDQPDDLTALDRIARTPGAAVERFSALSGTAIGGVAEAGTKALGATGIISPQTQASVMARLEDTINKFRNVDIVQDPGLDLGYITQGSGGGGYLGRALLSGVGTLVTSSPDMVAAAVGGVPGGAAYAATYAADLARQHAVNRTGDANASPTAEDYGYGFAIGLPSAALQMFGSNLVTGTLGRGMFKGLAEKVTAGADKVLAKYLGPATGAAMNRVRSAITTGGLEAITEFPQNQLDYLASTLGTDKFDVHEFWRQGVEGGVLAFLSGGIGGAVLPHGAKPTVAPPGGLTGLLGPDPGTAPGFGPLPPLPPARPVPGGHPSGTAPIVGTPSSPVAQDELFPPGTELTPPVRGLPPLPGPDPATHPLSEVGTVVDPSQLQLGDVAPAQGVLPLGERASGVGSERGLLDLYRNQTARRPMPGAGPLAETGTISDPGQSSLLSPEIVAAMDAHNALPEGAKPEQGEMFRRPQVEPSGPIPIRPQDLRGPAPAVHPLAETGTIVDAAQRSALNPIAGPGYPNAPQIDPGFLGRQAQANLRRLRREPMPSAATPEASSAVPAAVPSPALATGAAAPPVVSPTAPVPGRASPVIERLAPPPVAPTAVVQPEPVAAPVQPVAPATVPSSFTTALGSTYTVDGQSTQRTKTLHPGHETTDVGLKKPSDRTVYVSPEGGRQIGMHGGLSGRKTLLVRGDRIYPVAWNEAGQRWGISPSDREGVPFTTAPEVGKSPVELWGAAETTGATNWHAGNPIVSIGTAAPKLSLGERARQRLKGAAAGRPATTQEPAAPAQPGPTPVQPQGPQIAIGEAPAKPSFPSGELHKLPTPSRRAAAAALRAVAEESNQAGAAEAAPELRRRVKQIVEKAGVSEGDLEQAAGLARGGVQKQLDALERSRHSEGVAPVAATARTRKVPKVLKAAADLTTRGITVAGHILHGKASPRAALTRIINDKSSPVSRFLAPIAERLLTHNVSDVPIRYVRDLIARKDAAGLYYHNEHRIEIDASLSPEAHDVVLIHELIHAATVRAIQTNPELQAELEAINRHLEGIVGPDHPLAPLMAAMTEHPEELVAYAMTDPNAQAVLSSIRYGEQSLWTKIKGIIARALGLKTQEYTLLDRVTELTHQAMHEQAVARAKAEMTKGAPGTYAGAVQRETRKMGGYTTAVTNPRSHELGTRVDPGEGHSTLMAKLGREMPAEVRDGLGAGQQDLAWANYDHTRLPDGSIVLPDHNLSTLWKKPPAAHSDDILRARPGALKSGLLSTDPTKRREYSEGVFNRLRRLIDSPGERAASAVSYIQSIPQLVQWYRKHFGNDGGTNPLVKWMESFDARRQHEGALREQANDIQQRHNDLPRDEQTKLAEIAQFSTMRGVDPSRPDAPYTVAPDDKPALKATKERSNRAWQRARDAYQTLTPAAQQVMNDSRDFFRKSFGERRKLLLQQILEPRGVDVSRITAATPLSEVMQMFQNARVDPKKAPSDAERNILRLIKGTYHEMPIYFPLRRTGRYYTAVEHKKTVDYASPHEHLADTENQDDPTMVAYKVLKEGTDADPHTQVEYTNRDVAFHDSKQEGRDYLKQLKAENPALKDAEVWQPTLRRAEQGGHGLPAHTLISHLVDNLGQDTQAARDATDTVLAMLPELSQWKARMRRHNIPGAKPEQFRAAMAREMKNLSRQEAVLKYSGELAGHMKEMRDLQRTVNRAGEADRASKMNVLIGQLENLQHLERQLPTGSISAVINRQIGTLGFISYLASPAFAVVNATQVLTNTLPELGGKYGYIPAQKALHQASAAIHRKGLIARSAVSSLLGAKALARLVTSKVKPDEKLRRIEDTITENIKNSNVPYKDDIVNKLMPDLIARGRAGETQAQELLHTAREGGNISKTINDALEIAREMAQATEATNRVVSGMATYILERDKGSDHATASQAAVDNIDLTQFAYDPEYRSAAFRQLWRGTTQFKEYPLGTYNLLAQHFVNAFARGKTPEERAHGLKSLAGTALAYSIMGGVMGTLWNEPTRIFVNSLFYLWNQMTGQDVNPEDEMRKWLRDAASELGGSPWVGEAVVGGMPRLAGVDLSNRISLSQLLFPSSVRGSTPADKVGSALASFFFGPTIYNGVANAFTALTDPNFQSIMQALPIVPKTVQDIIKAYRLHDQGMTDNSGDTLIAPQDVDAYQMMVQALGFTPAQVSRLREKRGAVFRLQHAESDRRDALLQEYRTTQQTDRGPVMERIKAFNARHPVQPITNRTLINSLKARALREKQIRHVGGIALPNRQVPLVERAAGVMPP